MMECSADKGVDGLGASQYMMNWLLSPLKLVLKVYTLLRILPSGHTAFVTVNLAITIITVVVALI